MTKLGLVVKPGIDAALPVADQIVAWAKKSNSEVYVDNVTDAIMSGSEEYKTAKKHIVDITSLSGLADPIVTLGGDGTLIGVARYVKEVTPVMIGVNFGNLGFLTEIHPSGVIPVLEDVLSGKARFAERKMLSVEVYRNSELCFSSQAVNDAVIQKGVRERLLDLDCFVNGEDLMRIRADGLIIATPTGSTAYSLSAGGSIVHPMLDVALITPICPHSLTNRPVIIGLDSTVNVTVPPYDGKIFIIVDGQVSEPIFSGDEIVIRKSKNKVIFVRSPNKSYFDILRTKLNWGIANKSE